MYDKPAELAIIGTCLKEKGFFEKVKLSEDDFYFPQNKILWRSMTELKRMGRDIDLITMNQYLRGKVQEKKDGYKDYDIPVYTMADYTNPNLYETKTYINSLKFMKTCRGFAQMLEDVYKSYLNKTITPKEVMKLRSQLNCGS